MAKYPKPVHRYGEKVGATPDGQIIAPYAIPLGTHLRISDVTAAMDSGGWIFLSNEDWNAGDPAGRFYCIFIPNGGNVKVLFESPLLIEAGNSVYGHSSGATNLIAASWSGELLM